MNSLNKKIKELTENKEKINYTVYINEQMLNEFKEKCIKIDKKPNNIVEALMNYFLEVPEKDLK